VQGRLGLPCVPLTQQAFSFVSETDRHSMAVNYEMKVRRALKRIDRISPALLADLRVDVLEQPLFATADQGAASSVPNLEPADETEAFEGSDEFSCSETEKQEHIDWIVSQPERFVGYVLDSAFDVLAGIGNAREKAHIIEWMFAADIHGYLHYTEKAARDCGDDTQAEKDDIVELVKPIFSVDIPFTFQWCCNVFGLRADEYQAQVLDALNEAIAFTRERENQGELKPGRHKVYQDTHQLASAL
jgi:hypothetical protein